MIQLRLLVIFTYFNARWYRELVDEIELLHTDLKFIMTALGAKTIEELQSVPLVVKGETYHWLMQRDTAHYSRR